jgi:hypothetical protein
MDADSQEIWDDGPAMQKRWRAHKAKSKLEAFWEEIAPADQPFEEAKAIALLLVKLECCEMALGKIAVKDGPDAETAKAALAYRPPVW